ncbi:MAG: ArnT family glycosyltransferase [Candidatus Micrarchaeia archaeon]
MVAIISASIYVSMLPPYGPSYDGWDSYYYSLYAHNVNSFGYQSLPLTAFTTKYIMILWITLFYRVFGANLFADGFFGMPILAATAILVYLIGKERSGKVAGLLSALFVCFMPIILILSSSGGDDIFVAMFTTLSMATFVYGIERDSRLLYALAGFLGVVGATGSSVEEFMIFVVMLPIIVFYMFKRRNLKQFFLVLFFAAGIILGVLAIMAMGSALMDNPLAYFDARFAGSTYLASISNNSPSAGFFMAYLFHYPFNNLYNIGAPYSFPKSILINPALQYDGVPSGYNYFGYFGIAALISSAYLLLKRRYRSFVILFWFYALLLYLFFGTVSYRSYTFIFPLKRFLIILAPPMALTVGIAAAEAYGALSVKAREHRLNKKRALLHKYVLSTLLSVAIAFILINSLIDVPYMKSNNYIISEYFRDLGALILQIPAHSNIYLMTGLYNRNATNVSKERSGSVLDFNSLYLAEMGIYSSYARDINDTLLKPPECNNISNSSYFIIINSSMISLDKEELINITKFIEECGLAEVFYEQYPNNTEIEGVKSVGLYKYTKR